MLPQKIAGKVDKRAGPTVITHVRDENFGLLAEALDGRRRGLAQRDYAVSRVHRDPLHVPRIAELSSSATGARPLGSINCIIGDVRGSS